MTRAELTAYIAEAYNTDPDYPWDDSPDAAVFRHRGSKKWFALMMRVGKNKLGLPGEGSIDIVNVKCDPLLIGSMLQEPGIFPAYHMSKAHWVSIALDGNSGGAEDEKLRLLVDMSFEMTESRRKPIIQEKTITHPPSHKDTKWARRLIAMQDGEGKWGRFHSMASYSRSSVTTEQALRRLEILGYTIEDACIQKAVAYMDECLSGEKQIPDPPEKIHDWGIFTSMLLAAWIRRFTPDNDRANAVAQKWAAVVTAAFEGGEYDCQRYVQAYYDILGMKPRGGRLIDFVQFYGVSILQGCLDPRTEEAVVRHILDHPDGIYYIYEKRMREPPQEFQSRQASRYLAGLELIAGYEAAERPAKEQLGFAADWLEANRQPNGKWDMGPGVKDGVYFPLSDDWRRRETRENDCTERIERLLGKLI